MVLKIFHDLNYSMISFTVRIKKKTIQTSMLLALALSHVVRLDTFRVSPGNISAHTAVQQCMVLEGLVSPSSFFSKFQI